MPQSAYRSVKPRKDVQGQRRGGGPQALATSLTKVARRALGQRSLAERSLILDWPSIAGTDVASICTPRGLSFERRDRRMDGTLVLGVQAGQATRIQHLEPQLLERINGYLGYRAVARLRLQQGAPPVSTAGREADPAPVVEPAPSAGSDQDLIPDAALRAALERLGRVVKRPP